MRQRHPPHVLFTSTARAQGATCCRQASPTSTETGRVRVAQRQPFHRLFTLNAMLGASVPLPTFFAQYAAMLTLWSAALAGAVTPRVSKAASDPTKAIARFTCMDISFHHFSKAPLPKSACASKVECSPRTKSRLAEQPPAGLFCLEAHHALSAEATGEVKHQVTRS